MIMRNNKQENEINKTKRIFTRILEAAKPYMDIFDPDYENNTARGLLKTRCAAYAATLAYDPIEQTFVLIILLNISSDWTMPKVMILLRLQNRTATGSSTINIDTESSLLKVKSHARLPVPNVAQAVVSAALKDAIHVLEDDDFRKFVN